MQTGKSEVKITPLGAGQEVGRSCVLITIGDVMVMADCGMHMGYTNHKQFPDFSMIGDGDLTTQLDAVLLTHFHLDHAGALPFLTEKVGYSGPLIMSKPTRSIAPLLLQDFWRISRNKGKEIWKEDDAKKCMEKATAIGLHETIHFPKRNLKITAYYAGHVLGATMFLIEVNGTSVLYTGDYNTTSDRHLRGATLPPNVRPNVIITESTYGNTIRDSKKHRERDFLSLIYETVSSGGKVLIPVFAMGRAQELLILVEAFWKRMNLTVPIYFSRGMVGRANEYYSLYTNWASEAVTGSLDSTFSFPSVGVFNDDLLASDKPLVLFSTPGMLHAGNSLKAFKEWCTDSKNTVILPGYCVEGTVGHEVLTNEKPNVKIDGGDYHVKCKVASLPFSAHADARGIMKLIQLSNPQHVVLVHGDYEKAMLPLQKQIETETQARCYCPKNGANLSINIKRDIPVQVLPDVVACVHEKAKAALNRAAGFTHDWLEHNNTEKRQKRTEAGDVAEQRYTGDEKWWEKWGIAVGDEVKNGPCDGDCGCDIEEWEKSVKKMLLGRKGTKFPVLTQSFDSWGTNITVDGLVATASCTNETFHITVDNARDLVPIAAQRPAGFEAIIALKPLPTPAPEETLFPSILHTLQRCLPTLTVREENGAIQFEKTSISLERGKSSKNVLVLKWGYDDTSVAVRVHEVVVDSTGVAF